MTTRETFNLVAAVLKAQRDTMTAEAFTLLTKAFADKFQAENPGFKPALFFKAAGWVETKQKALPAQTATEWFEKTYDL